MTSKRTPAHVTTPIDPDTPGIEVANREPASWMFEIEFTPSQQRVLETINEVRRAEGLPAGG